MYKYTVAVTTLLHDFLDLAQDNDVDFSSKAWKIIREGAREESEEVTQDSTSPDDDFLDEEITSVLLDLKERMARDPNGQLKQGIQKFCQRYKQMAQQQFNDNRIASALNRFGWVFGGTVTSVQGGLLRRGRRIAVQATAAGRRRKTLSRGKSKAPSGRPMKKETQTTRTKGDSSRYHIPPRNLKPPKRLHSLSGNIALSQQNAGKW